MPLPACSTVSALCQLNIAITDTKHYLRQCICDLLSTVICPAYVPWSTFTTDARGLTCWSCSPMCLLTEMEGLVSVTLVSRRYWAKSDRHSPPLPPENREVHYDGQPPSCLILWITEIRSLSILDQQYKATYIPLVVLCCRSVVLPFSSFPDS